MSSTSPAISVQGLKKSYGDVQAVKGIDFEIQPGEVFGLLGPNGAGKTTTVEILEGLRPRSGGEVDRKSTRLNSSHLGISYAVFCLKKNKKHLRRIVGLTALAFLAYPFRMPAF